MPTLVARLTDIQQRLDALARHHHVPGACLAIGLGDQILDFATGVLNLNTGVETTPESLFQIGSNTKVLTTTLLMQLVDSGDLDIDLPVQTYLPSFALDDPTAAAEITTKQLLTHTSGIQGDCFRGYGRGDDAIGRYVESLAGVDLVHRPGEMWSYCNSGFVVAGHLAETLTGKPYHELLRERILQPLGMNRATVRSEEMLAHRCAVGHFGGENGPAQVTPIVLMEYAAAPAGSVTVTTARELVTFANCHLRGGSTPAGEVILSAASVAAMQQPNCARPATTNGERTQGLGWLMEEWAGQKVIGHGGGTVGQLSFLEAIPEQRLVVVLLTNSANGGRLWLDLGSWLFEELAGVEMARALRPPAEPPRLSLERYEGTYDRLGVSTRVKAAEGHLLLDFEMTGEMAVLSQDTDSVKLVPIDDTRFHGWRDGQETIVEFSRFERGRPTYMFMSRQARRVTGRRTSAAKHK
jgi:CubicO group peptidase (beta-lactamase class C family)